VRALLLLWLAIPLIAAEPTFKVRIGDTTVEAPRARYVAAVLAGEASVFQSDEALKAMAVAARTYAVRLRGRHAAEGFDFCSSTHCQRVEFNGITPRLQAIAASTAGELLWYRGKPAFTPYSRDCGGRTEDAAVVWPDLAAPYLTSRADPYCSRGGSSAWQWSGDAGRIVAALQHAQLRTPRALDRIAITQRTPSGRALNLMLWGAGESVPINAGSFRFAVGREIGWNSVLSDRYEVRTVDGRMVFQGSGSGHGVGLCQHGAEQMGVEHHSYREMLAFYFPGASLSVAASGISWQRLGGDSVILLTTDTQHDSAILAMADRQMRAVIQRTHWPAPSNVEILVYPDLDTFRDATGEPGWVAAHTVGRRIHLQPAAVLRAHNALEPTVRHELLHVLVESQSAAGLPLWFREGLVEFLDAPPHSGGPVRIPADTELRDTADAARARRAYDDAARAVADLVTRYGEATVLSWVTGGLPDAVKNTSTNQAPMKHR
jgi:stage II sporulation protein D